MFAGEIRRAIEAAPRVKLPEVAAILWRAFGSGHVTEAEAEALSSLIDARKLVPAAPAAPRKPVGSRPRSDASLERRRRWAASGWLPPAIAARFSPAETAVLAVVVSEIAHRQDCRLSMGEIAARAGTGRTTAKAAIREARRLGLISVEERRATPWRHRPNILRLTGTQFAGCQWAGWVARRAASQGVRAATTTRTRIIRTQPRATGITGEEATEGAALASTDRTIRGRTRIRGG